MNVLEAARRLADNPPSTACEGHLECCYCGADMCGRYYARGKHPPILPHKTDCPIPRLPQIVRALEAAEQAVDGAGVETVSAADIRALAAALRGDPPPVFVEDYATPDELDERGHIRPDIDAAPLLRRAAEAMRKRAGEGA